MQSIRKYLQTFSSRIEDEIQTSPDLVRGGSGDWKWRTSRGFVSLPVFQAPSPAPPAGRGLKADTLYPSLLEAVDRKLGKTTG